MKPSPQHQEVCFSRIRFTSEGIVFELKPIIGGVQWPLILKVSAGMLKISLREVFRRRIQECPKHLPLLESSGSSRELLPGKRGI